jgi:hypothetical protein
MEDSLGQTGVLSKGFLFFLFFIFFLRDFGDSFQDFYHIPISRLDGAFEHSDM